MTEVAGRTALVTGGASGIGLATARVIGREGGRVLLADIDAARLADAEAGLAREGIEVASVAFDVAAEDQWVRASAAVERFGPIDILFSNAGVGGGSGAFEDYDTEVWRWAYAVNAHAHLYACRTFLGGMKARGTPAHLVLTASMVGIVPPPISVAYISSKFATVGIAMALRNELAGGNVGISLLCPGMSATNIVETTHVLRPGAEEQGIAAETAEAMRGVLAGGMSPERIGERVVRAIRDDEFYIFTHPEWKRLLEPQIEEMLAAFGESADPAYAGDDIEGLLAANRARVFGAGQRAREETAGD